MSAKVFGAILLDGLLQSLFFGAVVSQVIGYWIDYQEDSRRKHIFVATVVCLSLLQTIVESYKAWRTLVQLKSWSTSPIQWSDFFLNGCISALCEGFYIRRCWKMINRSPWVLYPLSILAAVIMAANLYLAISMGIAFRTMTYDPTNDTLTTSHIPIPHATVISFSVWTFGTLALDAAVTSIMIISLWRSRTGLNQSDSIILYIIRITWESAALPSICMLVAVGLYYASINMDDHLVLLFVLLTGKLYTLGMLRMLNSRVKLRQQMQSHEFGRVSLDAPWSQWEQAVHTTARPSDAFNATSEPPKPYEVRSSVTSTITQNSLHGVKMASDNLRDFPVSETAGVPAGDLTNLVCKMQNVNARESSV